VPKIGKRLHGKKGEKTKKLRFPQIGGIPSKLFVEFFRRNKTILLDY
jgi:hypothetical protein